MGLIEWANASEPNTYTYTFRPSMIMLREKNLQIRQHSSTTMEACITSRSTSDLDVLFSGDVVAWLLLVGGWLT